MHTAPAASTPLFRTRCYRSVATAVAIILIAACAIFISAAGHFGLKNGLFFVLCAVCAAWLLWDAFRPVHGALHFAAGQWVLAQGDIEYAGTITPHLDLQRYLLVYFESDPSRIGHKKNIWLHLERRPAQRHPVLVGAVSHTSPGPNQDWMALRRAVFAKTPPPVRGPFDKLHAGSHEH